MTVVSLCSVLDRRWPYLRSYVIRCVRKEIASRTCASATRETRQISKAVLAAEHGIVKKKKNLEQLSQRDLCASSLERAVIIKTPSISRGTKIMIGTCRVESVSRRGTLFSARV